MQSVQLVQLVHPLQFLQFSQSLHLIHNSQQVHDNYQEPAVSSASSSHGGSETKQKVSVLDMLLKKQ